MARGENDETRELTELETQTADFDPIHDDPDEPPPVPKQRRPGLLLPLIVFVALLALAGLVGRYVVPARGPDPGAGPPAPGPVPTTATDIVGPPATDAAIPTFPAPPRPADELAAWAGQISAVVSVPVVAIQAYGYAQLLLRQRDPSCGLGWTTLAGIGEVESQHGQTGGAALARTGRSTPPIVGPSLDGAAGRALVRDTDAGAYDGDPSYDRAMGPMLLMPTAWERFAADADGDQILDPYDVDDAALAMALLLCSGEEDLTQLDDWKGAVGRHHQGDAFATAVFDTANSYGQRTRNIG